MAFKSVLFALIAVAGSVASAQVEGCDYSVKPKLIERPGQSPLIDYTCKEGVTRIAGLDFKESGTRRVSIPLQITETECGTSRPLCHAEVDVRAVVGKVVWRQNPDAAKIGQIVKIGTSEIPITAYVHDLAPAVSGPFYRELGPTKIVCDDWSWLPATAVAAKKWNVYRWELEFNTSNPETDRSENISVGGVQDINFIIDGREATATDRGAVTLNIGYRIPFLFGVNFLFMPDGQGGVCQVTAQAGDTARLANELRALEGAAVPVADLGETGFKDFRAFVGLNFDIFLQNAAAFFQ